jgi:hypothetical protein
LLGGRDIRGGRDKLVSAIAPGDWLLFGDCLRKLFAIPIALA